MSFHSLHSGTIVKGDLIAIAFDNVIHLAFYIGRGKSGTLQYYLLHGLAFHEYDSPDRPPNRWSKGYINAPHATRIMRVSIETLNDETMKKYEKAMIYLDRHGIKLKEK